MRVQENHAHATSIYKPTTLQHFVIIVEDLFTVKKNKYATLTIHLPFAIDNFSYFSLLEQKKAIVFIRYVELLKKIFRVKIYWENCPVFNVGTWDLHYGQTQWDKVPTNIELCVDTGHVMMGSKNKQEARNRLNQILKTRGDQIKHLHIHENNLISDQHINSEKREKTKRVITPQLLKLLQKQRTYIFEKPS